MTRPGAARAGTGAATPGEAASAGAAPISGTAGAADIPTITIPDLTIPALAIQAGITPEGNSQARENPAPVIRLANLPWGITQVVGPEVTPAAAPTTAHVPRLGQKRAAMPPVFYVRRLPRKQPRRYVQQTERTSNSRNRTPPSIISHDRGAGGWRLGSTGNPIMIQSRITATPRDVSPDAWLFVDEIEHRVANEYAMAMASIRLAAAKSASAETKAALAGASQRLRDFAEAHRALQAPAAAGLVDLPAYLTRLCQALSRASLNERGIRLTLSHQDVELEAGRCWRVGLIVSELITNAFRHGLGDLTGAIAVEIARSSGTILCRVRDNGRPPSVIVPGRGARLVDALAAELGGFIERRFDASGTTVLLSFPEDLETAGRIREVR